MAASGIALSKFCQEKIEQVNSWASKGRKGQAVTKSADSKEASPEICGVVMWVSKDKVVAKFGLLPDFALKDFGTLLAYKGIPKWIYSNVGYTMKKTLTRSDGLTMISWSAENSKVRDKMIFSATASTVRNACSKARKPFEVHDKVSKKELKQCLKDNIVSKAYQDEKIVHFSGRLYRGTGDSDDSDSDDDDEFPFAKNKKYVIKLDDPEGSDWVDSDSD